MWDFIHWALFLFNFFNKMFLKENGVGGLSCVGVGKEQRKEIIRLFFFFFVFFMAGPCINKPHFSLHYSARSE